MAEPLLEVRNLKVSFRTEDGIVRAVDGVSLAVAEGETLGVVGESGSGKSVTMMSVMRLINDPNAIFEGEVLYKGRDLMKLSQDQIRDIRGSGIAMIFQDPMTSLNPVYRIGWQIIEQLRAHENISKQAAHSRRRLRHGIVELVVREALVAEQPRALRAQRENFGDDRLVVGLAAAIAACDPGAEHLLAQLAAA